MLFDLKENNLIKLFLRFLGPGFLITVGFIDPGNWATNISGGAEFGYQLLWIITLSTLMLILIQSISARIGISTGKSLAVNIKENFSKPVSAVIGFTIVLACVATDVAELLGGAIGFKLLFHFPLWLGAVLTVAIEVFFIVTQRYHRLEKIIILFLGIIAFCYVIELLIVNPDWSRVASSLFIPKISGKSIYIAMGILGAVVMPHNIFLHSNVIHSREWGESEEEKKKLLKFEKIDTTISMLLGWVVNSAMIIVAAAVFFKYGIKVDSIEQASQTLYPLAGNLAGLLFGIALLFAGISSSITSSMAEVNVITGFLGKPEDPRTKLYKLATFITAIPSLFIILLGLDTFKILIFSQVVLSVQLPFTLIPLIILSNNKKIMGGLKINKFELIASIIVSAIVICLNVYLLYATLFIGEV
ncbi:manganese transport protein [Thermotomaculum hydrothermale]|uniref:Manganese transport protein n=1 Tax=Thermotomaculum hydrothermale TaxID=981385 RepID=A0A7R6SYG4_9BACT|nr:Nramp family divalent metal transporter [Thermotomaculum hydrothermale]BBB32620.1 manganese transport protein [Thermotomaculum hydrothermale]